MTVQEVKALAGRWQVVASSDPWPPLEPAAEFDSAKEMPSSPPASARIPVTVTWLLAPRAAFSGVSGCRNPGVTVSTAVAVVLALRVAVTTTWMRSAVR